MTFSEFNNLKKGDLIKFKHSKLVRKFILHNLNNITTYDFSTKKEYLMSKKFCIKKFSIVRN